MNKSLDFLLQSLDNKQCIPFELLQFMSPPPKTLICSICQCFVLNPVLCKCENPHLFGRKCLLNYLKTKNDCPISHLPLNLKQISSVSFELLDNMNQTKLKCEFCKEFQGNFNAMKCHLRECGFIEIPCPFFGKFCHEKIMKKDLKKHLSSKLSLHIDSAKNAFQIEKLQLLFEVLQEKFQ